MHKFFVILILCMPLLVSAQDTAKKKAYLFYGEQCPHCREVEEYFQASGIYDKYEIAKLEVTANPFNGKLFLDFGKAFGVSDWGGVPTVVFGDKYLVGDTPIIENFTREIEAAENTSEFPTPEKVSKEEETGAENQGEQPAESGNGNKRNYFPVVILALVTVGAGALLYVNRNKKS